MNFIQFYHMICIKRFFFEIRVVLYAWEIWLRLRLHCFSPNRVIFTLLFNQLIIYSWVSLVHQIITRKKVLFLWYITYLLNIWQTINTRGLFIRCVWKIFSRQEENILRLLVLTSKETHDVKCAYCYRCVKPDLPFYWRQCSHTNMIICQNN